MKVNVVEGMLEERGAVGACVLEGGERNVPIGEQPPLGVGGGAHQLAPGAAGERDAQRDSVEKKPRDSIAIELLEAPVGDEAGEDIRLAGEPADDAEMRREQNGFERHGGGARHSVE